MPIAAGASRDRCRAHERPETPDSILAGWRRYKTSGSVTARNDLVEHYMRSHVRPLATRMHAGLPNQVDVEDLIQQGYLGLIDAMDRFDLDREIRFETFSRRRIIGAIKDYLRSIDPVPRLTRARSRQVQSVRQRFEMEHGRPPSTDEMRSLLDVPEPLFRRLMADRRPAAFVPFSNVQPDGASHGGDDADAMDGFSDPLVSGPRVRSEMRDLQRWVVRGFTRCDRLIIVLYYYEQLTMLEIGRALGISESRVSQRLESILDRLRARLLRTGAEHEFVFG